MEVLLYNSTVCRLCGSENDMGTFLYSCEENNQSLSDIVNQYLPIKVSDDGELPRTICPGCTIQLEATVEFLNLIIKGQNTIRELHKREKEFKKTSHDVAGNGIITENIVYEINTDNGVYTVEHPIALQVAGLEKPKRKRGRPPKIKTMQLEFVPEVETETQIQEEPRKEDDEVNNGKRKRKPPPRFSELVEGKELTKMLKEEGLTDSDSDHEVTKVKQTPRDKQYEPVQAEVIGHTENTGEPIVVVKGKRGRPKGRMKPTNESCPICGMNFSCSGRYMAHIAQHGSITYQCGQCGDQYESRVDLNDHQNTTGHKGRNAFRNDDKVISPSLAAQTEVAKQIIKTEKSDELPKDPLAVSNELPDLNPQPSMPDVQEIAASPPGGTDASNGQDKDEADESSKENDSVLKSDETTPVPKPKLKCQFCDKTFSTKQSKSIHTKAVHFGEKPYICKICNAKFAYPRSLALHSVTHRRTDPSKGFACDLCGKILNHPSSVAYHKATEHSNERYVCNKCGKTFKHKQLLLRHHVVHSTSRPHSCKVCGATFKAKSNLLNHSLLHTGVKKYACINCNARFAHKTSLTLHMRRHNGIKPYSCNVCGKAFSQKGNLSEHHRIHTGEKPYQCGVCSRKFTTSSQRRLHIMRHNATKIQPSGLVVPKQQENTLPRRRSTKVHTCGVCQRTFGERWALVKHMRKHTGERPYKCPHCSRAFADLSNLSKHKKSVHRQVSLLSEHAIRSPVLPEKISEEPVEDEEEERVIYVTYDMDDDATSNFVLPGAEETVTIIEDEPSNVLNVPMYPGVNTGVILPEVTEHSDHIDTESVVLSEEHTLQVTDEQGNPLHFTMQDGTQLAITTADGKSLRVVTQDGQTIPVEINGFTEQDDPSSAGIIHQLSMQKVEEAEEPEVTFYTIV